MWLQNHLHSYWTNHTLGLVLIHLLKVIFQMMPMVGWVLVWGFHLALSVLLISLFEPRRYLCVMLLARLVMRYMSTYHSTGMSNPPNVSLGYMSAQTSVDRIKLSTDCIFMYRSMHAEFRSYLLIWIRIFLS